MDKKNIFLLIMSIGGLAVIIYILLTVNDNSKKQSYHIKNNISLDVNESNKFIIKYNNDSSNKQYQYTPMVDQNEKVFKNDKGYILKFHGIEFKKNKSSNNKIDIIQGKKIAEFSIPPIQQITPKNSYLQIITPQGKHYTLDSIKFLSTIKNSSQIKIKIKISPVNNEILAIYIEKNIEKFIEPEIISNLPNFSISHNDQ